MRKIKLTERNNEIYNLLPEEYAEIILNSVLARGVINGSLFQEISLFVTSDELREIKSNFQDKASDIKIKDVKERNPEEKIIKKKLNFKEEREEKAADVFTL